MSGIAHEVWHPGFCGLLRQIKGNELLGMDDLCAQQLSRLRSMLRFAFLEVPYYRNYAARMGISVDEIRTRDDLVRLPIVNRRELQDSLADFLPVSRHNPLDRDASTSGTTGTPVTYRLSRRDRAVGLALMYRGWGYSGYQLGDRVLLLAGRSLESSSHCWFSSLGDFARNIVKLSAFDMSDGALLQYVGLINRRRPAYVRGYASALRVLARRIRLTKTIVWQPRAVFTTAEVLLPETRKEISNAFGCPVFDGYGLNDGGVSAYECEEHCGFHVDMERSILEVVNEQGIPLVEGTGRIVATTLTNYAMPLVRYDTGDVGEMKREQCSCGRQRPLLKAIHGRSTDILVTPEGKLVHGWFFVYLLRSKNRFVKEFEVVQESMRDVSLILVPGEKYDRVFEDRLRMVIRAISPGWVVRIETVESIQSTSDEKMKYVRTMVSAVDTIS